MMILLADSRSIPLRDACVQCCATSPPYWGLRDYGVAGQIGLERTPEEYVATLVAVFREVRRILKDDGTLWINLGDCYCASPQGSWNGTDKSTLTKPTGANNVARRSCAQTRIKEFPNLKPKDLVGIPWRVAFALQADGWYLRSDIIWSKPNPMPESVLDRPTKSHEYVFLLSKSDTYYYDASAIRTPAKEVSILRRDRGRWLGYRPPGQAAHNGDPIRKRDKQSGHSRRHAGFNDRWDQMSKEEQQELGANARSVWTIATRPYPEAHFATFPEELPKRCILAGSRPADIVLDPFVGSGTTIKVATDLGRHGIGLELSRDYLRLAKRRTITTIGFAL
jgi:DNA modification methylase